MINFYDIVWGAGVGIGAPFWLAAGLQMVLAQNYRPPCPRTLERLCVADNAVQHLLLVVKFDYLIHHGRNTAEELPESSLGNIQFKQDRSFRQVTEAFPVN